MHWSKLRQLVEKRVAPSLAGRVRVMVTRYRHSHDQEGRWALVVDDEEIGGFDTISTFGEVHRLADEIAKRDGISRLDAHPLAIAAMQAQGRHSMEGFVNALKKYLAVSIEDCLASDDAVIRALGLLDGRLGRRRLAKIDLAVLRTELERVCLRIRLEAEGIRVRE